MRFGVVGTHFWAQQVHARGLQRCPEAELVGIWGRDPEKSRAAAEDLGVASYESYDRLLADVDAVTFAVPPDVQADLAIAAAQRGRHLLLEKPVATSVPKARELLDAALSAGVATTVFVTSKFTPEHRQWLQDVATEGPWYGATAVWLGSAFEADSPFNTPWRHEKGGLWDVGPHLLAALEDALGPVQRVVSAVAGGRGTTHLVLVHTDDRLSAATVTLEAPRAAARVDVTVWGESGVTTVPSGSRSEVVDAFATAAGELVRAATDGTVVTVDLAYGVHLVEVLAEAERLTSSPVRR